MEEVNSTNFENSKEVHENSCKYDFSYLCDRELDKGNHCSEKMS